MLKCYKGLNVINVKNVSVISYEIEFLNSEWEMVGLCRLPQTPSI